MPKIADQRIEQVSNFRIQHKEALHDASLLSALRRIELSFRIKLLDQADEAFAHGLQFPHLIPVTHPCRLQHALAGLLNFVNHDFISVLWTDPAGIKIANIVMGMMAVGAIWLYKLVQIRV